MIANVLSLVADSGPTVHIAPGAVWQLGGLTITNSILYGWICIVAIGAFLIWVAHQVTIKPKGGVVQYVEVAVSFITDLVEGAFDDEKIGRKYVPYFVTLFFFILLNNWLGLLPIVGEGFKAGSLPLLRPFTGDLDGTLALGLVTMLLVYVASVRESGGPVHYIKHFFVGNPLNPIFLLVGILEMLTDLTRVISLSLRLFLNVTIGEILIAVFSYLGHIAAPLTALPFTLLEVAVDALQAYIFTILAVMYLAVAVNGANDHSDDLTEDTLPETIEVTHGEAISG
ncbi:MAG TPA: F0F1 ATP synthase subunit A [Verrucomicrobiae bacterium]|jgi:F-type H+-transporting ATPase subunit a|nr:F0F1 ATP synthase subunit A [Verrucomicrobiae bacterium]